MKNLALILFLGIFSISCYGQSHGSKMNEKTSEGQGYKVGDRADDFDLKNAMNGKMHSLAMVEDAKGYIVVFTSNECPFAIAYEDRLIDLHNRMAPQGYPVIAINSNDGAAGGGNTVEDMKGRSEEKHFPFVYLKDEDPKIYQKFGATKTPHVFLLDRELVVRYIGAIDDNSKEPEMVKERYVENAIAALQNGSNPDPATTKAIGCPIASKGGKGGPGGPGGKGRKGPPSPDQILEMMDKDNDKMVSKSEVHGPLARDFDSLDADNNGKLSKEELLNLKKKKH